METQDSAILRYKRALERSGVSPRDVAAGLLGVDSARFLLLFEVAPAGAPAVYAPTARNMTGVLRVGSVEHWRALRAVPVLAVAELADLSRTLRARALRVVMWDSLIGRTTDGNPFSDLEWNFDRLEDGWRLILNGPPEFQVTTYPNVPVGLYP